MKERLLRLPLAGGGIVSLSVGNKGNIVTGR